jgi:hypothetical protein
MPMGFPVEGFASGRAYEPRAGDIFVASYPKCGTTWTQYIVYQLVNDGRPLAPGESLGDVFPHLEEVGREAVAALPEPRLIKTHLTRELTPRSTAAKYVLVIRNPFDCAVSFYHHTRGFPKHYAFSDGTFAEFFECFVEGQVDFGDYFEHLTSWLRGVGAANLLVVTYEAMKADPRRHVVEIGRFLGGRAARTADDAALVERIVAESGIDSMRKAQRRWSSERPADMPAFIREGRVGGWRALFTPEQAERLLARLDRAAENADVARYWPDVVEQARRFAAGS